MPPIYVGGSTANAETEITLLFYNFHGFGSVIISDKLNIINAGGKRCAVYYGLVVACRHIKGSCKDSSAVHVS